SMPIMGRLNDRKVSVDTLLMYAHHIDQGIRSAAARAINNHGRYHLVVPLLKSKDPRGRHAGVTCITGMFKGLAMPSDKLTDEMFKLVTGMINDPQESWWVVDAAMNALGRARPELIAPHVDRLAYWLRHDDWWLRKAAMTALTPVATDKRFYRQILPIIGEMIATNNRPVALAPVDGIVRQLQKADPEVQKYAIKVLGKAYLDFPTKLSAPGGQDMSAGVAYLLDHIAGNLSNTPGGFDELYRVSKIRFPEASLPHKELYLGAEPSRFGQALKVAFNPIIVNELVPEYIGNNRTRLQSELTQSGKNGRTVEGLVSLFQKAGIDDYNWKLFGPKRDKIKWEYHTFDPAEKKLWEHGWRYRDVSWPPGMEHWFAPEFNARAAGFETGYAPFAKREGKLQAMRSSCSAPFCGCGDKPNTFWDKEVLLMRGEIQFPPVRKGYSYRLLVGGRSHVNAGDGSDVWINGKQIKPSRKGEPLLSGVGKRQGGVPWGIVLSDEFLNEFDGGKVTIAVTGFMNIRGNYQTIWLEEMKMPTVTDADIFESAKYTALKSTEYFVEMDAEKMYRWGGRFISNPKVLGNWQVVNQVSTVEEFNAEAPRADLRSVPFSSVTFKDNARTDNDLRFWSGDTLIDLNQNFALKMAIKTVGGTDYLLIEAGQIPRRVEAGWKPNFLVLKRK
ncbi:MAG: DNA alkylation repair protein, partial [Phycisphaerae bacterium]|nr:DNA alkylation repair protein [Phycisphaerae bacterium]